MESGETFTDDEIEPSEHDYDLKNCVQYFYLGSNRKNYIILLGLLFEITIA